MIFKDYYKILELDTCKVSSNEIKIAFREQAKKYHPDINTQNKFSEERFKDINEAYNILSNQSSKRKYDRMWNTHVGRKKAKEEEQKREKGSIFIDIYNMFLGNKENENNINKASSKKKVPIKGDNIETEISVSVEEAFYGVDKKISLRTISGQMKTFTIKIPAGIRKYEKIRLLGQGKLGENGGKAGDLFIKINIENTKKYRLEGIDIYTDLLLTPWEAALGTRVSIQGISESVSIYIPKGIQSGEKVKIQAKGYKDGKGGRGDLVAEVKTVVPKTMTQEEKELFEKFSEISKYNPREELT